MGKAGSNSKIKINNSEDYYMPLPINISELITGKTVEWERIEFKEGWNPEKTLRTICAFANDFNNWGGGYIILGIAEFNGQPVLPPTGLQLNQIDTIQQKLNNICRKITPDYFPIVEPVDFQSKKILILWCPGGNSRPYKAPDRLGKNPQYINYIRKYSSTVKPTRDEERELISMANQVPFDDQVNHNNQISEFDLTEIKTFLNDVGSDLEKEIPNLSLNDISRKMNIAEGSDENLLPKNVGLLFFAKNPQRIFPSSKIEIVTFEDETGSSYTEKIFEGTVQRQLKNALEYLKDIIVKEKIIKEANKAESNRFYNYPYDALEEALCNAVYHRGYDNDSPIEVRIYPSRIDIISFPGPLLPLDKERMKNYQFDVRKYRNRRIGEFLKELHLTEGRATGVPTIIKSLEKNKSPKPIFETDDNRTYFKTTFYPHPLFNLAKYAEDIGQRHLDILNYCSLPRTRDEIFKHIKMSNHFKNYSSYIVPLIDKQLLNRTIPDSPKAPNQKYLISLFGKEVLEYLKNERQ